MEDLSPPGTAGPLCGSRAEPTDVQVSPLAKVLRFLGFLWFGRSKPAPLTINEPWRAAAIEAREAKERGDTRRMHAARLKAQSLAHAELVGQR